MFYFLLIFILKLTQYVTKIYKGHLYVLFMVFTSILMKLQQKLVLSTTCGRFRFVFCHTGAVEDKHNNQPLYVSHVVVRGEGHVLKKVWDAAQDVDFHCFRYRVITRHDTR